MFKGITRKFKLNPSLFYAMSIAATWANAGSLLNGTSTVQHDGLIPFLLWALGNTLACIIYGMLAPVVPKLREVFRSKPMKIIMGIMCPFQCWISMNGIQTVWADTMLGDVGGIAIGLAIAAFFIFLLWRYGMIRNVLTDHYSWLTVYGLVFVTVIFAFFTGKHVPISLGSGNIGVGIKNCLLLIPGAFLYPYFYEILEYNDQNEDGTTKINVREVFIGGGVAFGIYLFFILLLGFSTLSTSIVFIRAFLVTLIAASSLSSFLYSIYLTFGKPLGLAINLATVALWQFLIPLGVMGAWQLMASIRVYIVVGAIIAALLWHFSSKRKEVRR